jgi:heat-inducible transcriptional repressor
MGSFELSERSRQVLATLVREHVESGEPVSSQVVARNCGLGVSPATVRSVLAHLEETGFVHQPHTSAGRVPTDQAYRTFVNMLLADRRPARPPAVVEHHLRRQAGQSPLVEDLLMSVSRAVSRAARHLGFAVAGTADAVLERISFVPLEGTRVLVVVVARGNRVTQKVIEVADDVRPDDLIQAANYLNTEFGGLPLLEVREAVLARLQQERTLYDRLLARALRLARVSLDDLPAQPALHVDGVASLVEAAQGAPETLRALLEMVEQKERLLYLLNQYIDGPGLTVVIGGEHLAPGLRPFSLIASTTTDGGTIRTVGLIGPTRMHYSRAISLVDGTARAVTRVLRDVH